MNDMDLVFTRSMLPPAPSELVAMPKMHALRTVSSTPPPDPRHIVLMAGGLLLFFITCAFTVIFH